MDSRNDVAECSGATDCSSDVRNRPRVSLCCSFCDALECVIRDEFGIEACNGSELVAFVVVDGGVMCGIKLTDPLREFDLTVRVKDGRWQAYRSTPVR